MQTRYGKRADAFFRTFPFTTDEEASATKAQLAMLEFAGLPGHRLATYNSAATYLYEFNHAPPAKENFPDYGAFHTSEVPYALHTLHTWNRKWEQWDKSLEETMSSYWVNFAKTGNPNGAGLPKWKAYAAKKGFIMELGDQVKTHRGMYKDAFRFLEE
jgi:para-nitrobenzyl esterase